MTPSSRSSLERGTLQAASVLGRRFAYRLLEAVAPGNGDLPERVLALQQVIQETAESLQLSPRQAKLYRALYYTYFQPAPTQERAAEVLDLPFSTYRRHLKAGVMRLTEILWQREIGALEK